MRVVGDDDVALVRQVLQAQEYWRLKGLSADVVILNEHPVELSRRDAGAADGAARRRAVAARGSIVRAAPTCCAPIASARRERTLLEAVARAVLGGDRGDLRAQLDSPASGPDRRAPAFAAVAGAEPAVAPAVEPPVAAAD